MRRGPWVVSAALALLALGPALAPGLTLSYDMVFVPRLDLTRDVVGLGDGLPRAVPVDAVVAVLTTVVPGGLLQKAVLLATLVLAGAGAGRLTGFLLPEDRGSAAAVVAAAVYVWNPYVAERLVLGHWALLVAYAALPWLVVAAHQARDGDRRAVARLVLLLGACALTPTGGLLGALVAGCVLAGRWRMWLLAAGAWVVLDAPWWLPGLVHEATSGEGSAAAGVAAFAARGEGVLGPVGSVAGLGGVWSADVVPGSRETVLGVLATVVLLGLAALGAGPLRRSPRGLLPARLAVASALGIALALAGATPGLRDLLADLVREVPAAGLLRDGQKWVAPWALLLSAAAGAGIARLTGAVRDRGLRALVPAAAVVVVVALLPDMAWGVAGRLRAVDYPPEWQRAREAVSAAGGDVVVLPWGAFRRFDWNGDRTVLDPAGRYLPGSVVTDDDLVVGTRRIPGEGQRAQAARDALAGQDAAPALRRLGVRWVLVHVGQPGAAFEVPAGRAALESRTLRLVRLAGPVSARPLPPAAPAVLAGGVVALLLMLAAAVLAGGRGLGRRPGLLVGRVRGGGGPDAETRG
jgi:hypothetical protein